jgi:NAD+ kinase
VPVLGVACGSLGVLTSVRADVLAAGLEQVTAGEWEPRALPGLELVAGGGEIAVAINDFAIVRRGMGQVVTAVAVDGELYARAAGDGAVVATPVGSSAYTMAAGGPILAPGARAMVVTLLAAHGGVAPPLVVGPDSRIELTVEPGYGGVRFELDGQEHPAPGMELTVRWRADYTTLVELRDQEPMLTGLRRRRLIVDGPRVLVRDARTEEA